MLNDGKQASHTVIANDIRPIGVFDSGLGGLTIAREIARQFPHESLLYVGDTRRCPYGNRSVQEVRSFVLQISRWLTLHDVKALVIACNTATASGLQAAQEMFDIPIIGVIKPGARSAVKATKNGRIGVLATTLTARSGAYTKAIHCINRECQVINCAAQPFVTIVEEALDAGANFEQDWYTSSDLFMDQPTRQLVEKIVAPLLDARVDTVVTGCTHFPLLRAPLEAALGDEISLVSSAPETCEELREILRKENQLVLQDIKPTYTFVTTSSDTDTFRHAGEYIFGSPFMNLKYLDIADLEKLA